ncbi:unnamed protein product [Thlaspi arvense]|uniref:PUM-HD domain-containing protein n=1 Tax=Thlaspi arvense TaxID=13288 RepID=A0AAU9SV43_THLAR|nr:unnamed protein product [Thlaspi arvense]
MSNHDGKNPMPYHEGEGPMFAAFRNLNLNSNNNRFERGSSSNSNIHNLNLYFNLDQNSQERSRLSAGGFRVPPSPPSSWITQPGASSSINSGQPLAHPQSFVRPDHVSLCSLVNMMTCPIRYPQFLGLLRRFDTYEAGERERRLLHIGSMLTTNHSTFLDVATNRNGSMALRTLLQRSPSLDKFIFKAVCMNFFSLMSSKYGRFLIVPTIRAVDKPRKEIIYELTYHNTLTLARNDVGCVALNDVFQEIRGIFRDQIFDLVAQEAQWLSFDPYGTHVVQNFLTLQNPCATQAIAENLYGSFFLLARVRQGSYVVEKCLKSEFGREKVLEEFRGNYKEWVRMANDKFGNFVAQCALKVMKQGGMKQLLREFVEKLRPHFHEMEIGHGKNTLRVIEEEIQEFILDFPDPLLGFVS